MPWLAADLEVGGDGVLRWWEEYVRRLDSGHYHVTHLLPADQVHDGNICFRYHSLQRTPHGSNS